VTEQEIKRELLLFVEGKRTEEDYFVFWHRRLRERVRVTVDDFHGAPLQLVERAIRAKKKHASEQRRGRGRAYDEVWCVFDRDEHAHYTKAIELADANGIHVAISNPCIELWFILHFEDQTAYIDRHSAQSRSEECLGCSKTLTQSALDTLAKRHDDAADRAKRLDEKHLGDGSPAGSNPSSQVWMLIERMRSA